VHSAFSKGYEVATCYLSFKFSPKKVLRYAMQAINVQEHGLRVWQYECRKMRCDSQCNVNDSNHITWNIEHIFADSIAWGENDTTPGFTHVHDNVDISATFSVSLVEITRAGSSVRIFEAIDRGG
jgi:hypothetical protein